jgi:L-rhamnose-H+ transport protein
MNSTAIGLSIVLAAGAIGSATLLPMKFVRRWQWENSWLTFALFAYLFFPVVVAWLTVPDLADVYHQAGGATIAKVALYGLGWGLSVVMLGLAVAAAGLAVSNAVILGCSISLGSLIPLAMYDGQSVHSGEVLRIVAANVLLLGGVVLCAAAGYIRDRRPADEARPRLRGGGLALCFVAGILTPLLNVALAAGEPITTLARSAGAATHQAANAVWGLAVGVGSLPSILYCAALLRRRGTLRQFSEHVSAFNVALCFVMGALFIVSTIGYGSGALKMGPLGPAIGWPVYVSSLLIGNSFWGWLTGEWLGAPRRATTAMASGLALQVVGIGLLFMVAPA